MHLYHFEMECDSATASPCSPYVAAGRVRNDNRQASSGDSSCVRVNVERHPLRFDREKNVPRLEAHPHPLRLVHSKYLYPRCNGRYVCDIGNHESNGSGFVLNCSLCEFDICLNCLAQPCFNCQDGMCHHTHISVKLV